MKCKICGKESNMGTCKECYYEYHESKEDLMSEGGEE